MHTVLRDAGSAFLKAFASSLLVVFVGISAQPTLHSDVAVAVAGIMASIAAGIAAVQTFVPALSFQHWVKGVEGKILDSFTKGFVAALLVSLIGLLHDPSLSTWHSAVVGVMVGAINAGLRATEQTLTPGASPLPTVGVSPPKPPAS